MGRPGNTAEVERNDALGASSPDVVVEPNEETAAAGRPAGVDGLGEEAGHQTQNFGREFGDSSDHLLRELTNSVESRPTERWVVRLKFYLIKFYLVKFIYKNQETEGCL